MAKAYLAGTASTNVILPRLHNLCVDRNWLPWPIIPKLQWPLWGMEANGPHLGKKFSHGRNAQTHRLGLREQLISQSAV
jgi:hypothetical protein